MRVGRHFHIDSSHILTGHPKCGVMHGHTYRIEVVLEGAENDSGMLVDFSEIRQKTEAFLDHLDHVHLNEVIEMPTVENLARYIHGGLREDLPQLAIIKVWEGAGKYAEFRGES
jgi:6-pyruvoyltetrahydropterin/6-carboxytetrahydropterin synthase